VISHTAVFILALYAFQGATDSSGFAPLSLEGEGLGERGNSLEFHIGGEKDNYIFMSISLVSIKSLHKLPLLVNKA